MKKIEQNRPAVEMEAMSGPELHRHALALQAKAAEQFHAVPAVQKAVKIYETALAEAKCLAVVALKRFREDRPEPLRKPRDLSPAELAAGGLRIPDRVKFTECVAGVPGGKTTWHRLTELKKMQKYRTSFFFECIHCGSQIQLSHLGREWWRCWRDCNFPLTK